MKFEKINNVDYDIYDNINVFDKDNIIIDIEKNKFVGKIVLFENDWCASSDKDIFWTSKELKEIIEFMEKIKK